MELYNFTSMLIIDQVILASLQLLINFKPGQLTRFGGFLWIESEDAEERQEVHAGNLVFAGGELSDAFQGFMNGAAQTGRLAADFVVRHIAELTVASRQEPECRVA